MVPEIWERDRWNFLSFRTVFCPFTPLWTQEIKILKKWKKQLKIYHFTNVYHKWWSYDVWILRYGVQQTEFSVTLDFDLLPAPPLEKMTKTPGEIIISHKCTKKSLSYATLHCSWDTICDGCNSYFLFWANFCPLTPLTIQKINI